MFDDFWLVILGAGVSLATTIVVNYLEYIRRETVRKKELLESLLEYVGRAGTLGVAYESRKTEPGLSAEELNQFGSDYIDNLVDKIKDAKGDSYYHAYLRGVMDSFGQLQLQNLEYLDNEYINELEKKIAHLEDRVKELQKET